VPILPRIEAQHLDAALRRVKARTATEIGAPQVRVRGATHLSSASCFSSDMGPAVLSVVHCRTKLSVLHMLLLLCLASCLCCCCCCVCLCVQVPNVTWGDVGGLEDVKQAILDTIELPLKHRCVGMASTHKGHVLTHSSLLCTGMCWPVSLTV
jgi:hypothetical protein